ncbi:MAG: adenylate/guanylate cyclase domain-containing protein [Bacteroidota bacterium]
MLPRILILIITLASASISLQAQCLPDFLKNQEITDDSLDYMMETWTRGMDVFSPEFVTCIDSIENLCKQKIWTECLLTALAQRERYFYWHGEYKKGIDMIYQMLPIIPKSRDSTNIRGYTLGALGEEHLELGHYDKAKSFFEQAAAYPDYRSAAFNGLGMVSAAQGNNQDAIRYYQQYLEQSKLDSSQSNIALAKASLGGMFLETEELDSARIYISSSLKLFQELEDAYSVAWAELALGKYYLAAKQPQKALSYLTKGFESAKSFQSTQDIVKGHNLLSEAYAELGNYKSAYLNHKAFKTLADSLVNADKTREVAELEMSYEFEKKQQAQEAENQQKLQQQRFVTYGVIAALLAALLLAFAFYRNYRNKQSALVLLDERNQIIQKEKEKSDNLLLNILPKATAEELKAKGKATPRYFENTTILLSDFVGFTQIAEQLTANQLVEELDRIFQAFDDITARFGLEKIKTIGDAYMCVGGLPIAKESHAIDMTNAALNIMQYISNYQSPYGVAWKLRLGINSGSVTAGVVGKKKFAYDIWGDAVNLAARMETKGEAGKVNVSESTYQLIKHQFECQYRGKVKAKNKGEVNMYFVLGKNEVVPLEKDL